MCGQRKNGEKSHARRYKSLWRADSSISGIFIQCRLSACKNEQTALDMVSECIIKGYENIGRLREPKYFRTWMTRILLNAINDYYRKNPVCAVYEDACLAITESPNAGISPEEK